jgi:DNA mismatch endonuclease, patch repair protein
MRRVQREDTSAEMALRKLLHGLGFRYRLHDRSLPGSPDLVFPSRRCVIYVHGCFWHGHSCKRGRRRPVSNASYWAKKLENNRKRDRYVKRQAKRLGWRTLEVWECDLSHVSRLLEKVLRFLGDKA